MCWMWGLQELENFKEEKNYFGRNGQGRPKGDVDFYSDLEMQGGVCLEGKKHRLKECKGDSFSCVNGQDLSGDTVNQFG